MGVVQPGGGLDPEQAAAVESDERYVAILAGAGSGKTRVLTRRIARRLRDESADPRHVLAVTFTRRAAAEMRARVGREIGSPTVEGRLRPFGRHPMGGPHVHTFHALGGALLQRWCQDRRERSRPVTRARGELVAEAARSMGAAAPVSALAAEIEWAKARAIRPYEYASHGTDRPGDEAEVASVFATYEALKARRGVIDVDDFITEPLRLLTEERAFGDAQRWWYRHVFVDEFQDVNPAQFALLQALLGPDSDLCVVGDPNQAIYGWNGAEPTLLTNLADHYPGLEVHHLTRNYRSRRPIVSAAAEVLALPTPPVATDRDDSDVPRLVEFADDGAEAVAVAGAVRAARDRLRVGWQSVAVLAREARQLDAVAAALRARDIPYRLPGSLLDRPEVRAVLAELRRIDHVGRPLRDHSYDLIDLCDRAAEGRPFADGWNDDDESEDESDQPSDPTAALRRAHLDSLLELIDEYVELVPQGDLEGFVHWAQGVLSARGADVGWDGTGVALLTLHRAKGLEWPAVFMIGCSTTLMPHRLATSKVQHAEERRLAYVAMTRATEELHCSWGRTRSSARAPIVCGPSPLLAGLPAATGAHALVAVHEGEDTFDADTARRALADIRRRLTG